MDEIWGSDHTDSREVRVIEPIDEPDLSVPVPYDSHSKRSRFVACIVADGFRMKSFAILLCFTAEKELRYYGYDESNVVSTSQSNALITRALFDSWNISVFFSTIDQRRRGLGHNDKAQLLMDGLRFHHAEPFLVEYPARNIGLLLLITHASGQLQPLVCPCPQLR
jgi:hypothetical protein